jgi:hypothetical protein
MEATFTLIFWITMGWRFEEAQLPLLYRDNCAVYRDELLRERSPVRAECVQDPPLSRSREIYTFPPGDYYGPLPGRRRV